MSRRGEGASRRAARDVPARPTSLLTITYRLTDDRLRREALAVIRDRFSRRAFAVLLGLDLCYVVPVLVQGGITSAVVLLAPFIITPVMSYALLRRRLRIAVAAYGDSVRVAVDDESVRVEQGARSYALPLTKVTRMVLRTGYLLLRWPDRQYLVLPAEVLAEGLLPHLFAHVPET